MANCTPNRVWAKCLFRHGLNRDLDGLPQLWQIADDQGDDNDQDDPAQQAKPLGGRTGLHVDVIVLHGRLEPNMAAWLFAACFACRLLGRGEFGQVICLDDQKDKSIIGQMF